MAWIATSPCEGLSEGQAAPYCHIFGLPGFLREAGAFGIVALGRFPRSLRPIRREWSPLVSVSCLAIWRGRRL